MIRSIIESIIPGARRRRLVKELAELTRRYEGEVALKVSDLMEIRELEGRARQSVLRYLGLVGIWLNLGEKEAEERLKSITETIGEKRLRKLTVYELAELIDGTRRNRI